MNSSDTTSRGSLRIAVVGATGNQGGSVVQVLLGGDVRVRALVRDSGKPAAQALAARAVELTVRDLTDGGSTRYLLRWGGCSVRDGDAVH
jgi:uncharacterized protein YbjT (DUF2867 family)